MNWLPNYNYILASKSPRRQELLHSLGVNFQVLISDVDETYPENLTKEEIPVFLAELKAKHFKNRLKENDLLITADTIVWLNGEVIGKPENKKEAIKTLQKLSAHEHQVISGVCLSAVHKQKSFFSISNVRFKELSLSPFLHFIITSVNVYLPKRAVSIGK